MNVLSELVIRQLRASDAEAFSELRRLVTSDNPVPMGLTLEEELTRPIDGFRAQLSLPEPNAAFGALLDGELVGSAAVAWPSRFLSSAHKVNLWGTFVHPEFRGQGIGRAVVERAIEHARTIGVRRVNLTVYVPNEPALALYESLGFERTGFEPEAVFLAGEYFDGVQMSLFLGGT